VRRARGVRGRGKIDGLLAEARGNLHTAAECLLAITRPEQVDNPDDEADQDRRMVGAQLIAQAIHDLRALARGPQG